MRSPAEAAREILDHVTPLPAEMLPIADSLGRVLAENVVSPIDVPPWDNSAMDGYAVASEYFEGVSAPVDLKIVEEVAAGRFPTRRPGLGECTRIFTGAPIPEGTDSVIRQEDVTVLENSVVRVNDMRDVGRNVRRSGEDIEREDVVLSQGTELGPAQIGVLASIARSEVAVHRAPTVAILASGDEIVGLDRADEIIAGKKIASSNSYTLRANIELTRAKVLDVGIARDDRTDTAAKLSQATAADVIVTSAGVSVGDHDYVRTVMEEMGAQMHFWRIAMRPGAPVGFGIIAGKPWLGLPGNPVSTMVTFELFVRPLIRRLQGHRAPFRRSVPVTLAEPIDLAPPLTHFLRGIVRQDADGLNVRLTGSQGSGILTSMVQANSLLIVPRDKRNRNAGQVVQAIMLDDSIHVEHPPF